MDRVPITKQGYAKLEEELTHRKSVERPAIIQAIAEARAHGDLSENAEYHAAKEKQSFNEGRIMELEDAIGRAQVIDPASISGDTIKFGATVTLYDIEAEKEVIYMIVGQPEADIRKNLISIASPIARALIGKKVDDEVSVTTPGGKKSYEVVSLHFGGSRS